MPDCYMVLGADRVGKGTIISNSIEATSGNVHVRHFSAPPNPFDPWEQYENFLKESFVGISYVFCDRGFPETYFYESWRNKRNLHIKDVSRLVSEFDSRFNNFHITIVKRDWNIIRPYHVEEIENGIRDIKSNESDDLAMRYVEYCAYYRVMRRFYEDFSEVCTWVENPPRNYTLVKE